MRKPSGNPRNKKRLDLWEKQLILTKNYFYASRSSDISSGPIIPGERPGLPPHRFQRSEWRISVAGRKELRQLSECWQSQYVDEETFIAATSPRISLWQRKRGVYPRPIPQLGLRSGDRNIPCALPDAAHPPARDDSTRKIPGKVERESAEGGWHFRSERPASGLQLLVGGRRRVGRTCIR